jgi:hypothetical protein
VTRRQTSFVLVPLSILALLVGCGAGHADTRGTAGSQIVPLDKSLLPDQMLGLQVSVEDVSKTLANTRQSYVNAVSLFGFRKDQLLQATLQISRFNPGGNYQTDQFHQQVLNGVGNAVGQSVQVGGIDVFLTLGSRQRIFEWFRGPYWFVLSVRDDFTVPRSLLRQLLDVKPS